MWAGAIILAIFFAIFAAIEWNVVSGLFRHSVDDVSDLVLHRPEDRDRGQTRGARRGAFFVGHFGGFMTGHFLLLYSLFLRGLIPGRAPGATAELSAIFLSIWTSIAALFISHGVSFVTNFIGQREYDGTSVKALMTAPYNRIVVMHLTLIFGGWIVLLLGMPTGALVILLLLKTAVDLRAHRKEHAVAGLRRDRVSRESRGERQFRTT